MAATLVGFGGLRYLIEFFVRPHYMSAISKPITDAAFRSRSMNASISAARRSASVILCRSKIGFCPVTCAISGVRRLARIR